jgi:uncharacterized membrane protein
MKSLYFRVPTVENATKIVQELASIGIPEKNVTVVGKDHFHLKMAHLREAGILQTTDLLHALLRGLSVGALAGLAAGILLWLFPFEGLTVGWGWIIGLLLLGAGFGAWGSTLIGISIPNPIIEQCEKAIEAGELILFVHIPPSREEEVISLIKRHHPEALIEI